MLLTAGTLVVTVGIVIAEVWWIIRRDRRRQPRRIIERLEATREPFSVHLWLLETAWNPADPSASGRRYGPGQAVYTIDDADMVHLEWQPLGARAEHLVGPIPEGVNTTTRLQVHRHRLRRGLLAGYATVLLLGFLLGYVLASGSPTSRLLIGLLGVVVAFGVMWLATLSLGVASGVKSLRQRHSR